MRVQERRQLQAYAQQYSAEISHLLLTVPRDLLLLLKTNDCLRSLEHRLAAPLNSLTATARACSMALAERDGLPAWRRWGQAVRLEVQLWALRTHLWWHHTWLCCRQGISRALALPNTCSITSGRSQTAVTRQQNT